MGEQILLPALFIIDKARKIANNISFHILPALYIIITAHMQHCYDLYHWLPLSLLFTLLPPPPPLLLSHKLSSASDLSSGPQVSELCPHNI